MLADAGGSARPCLPCFAGCPVPPGSSVYRSGRPRPGRTAKRAGAYDGALRIRLKNEPIREPLPYVHEATAEVGKR